MSQKNLQRKHEISQTLWQNRDNPVAMAVAELAEIWKEEQIRTFSLADDEFQFYQAQAKYNLADKLSELFKRPSLRKDLS